MRWKVSGKKKEFEKEEERSTEERWREGTSALETSGTCGGFGVHRLQEAFPVHGVHGHHVAGVRVQPGHQQAEGAPGQSEVLALHRVLQVR